MMIEGSQVKRGCLLHQDKQDLRIASWINYVKKLKALSWICKTVELSPFHYKNSDRHLHLDMATLQYLLFSNCTEYCLRLI